MRDVGDFASPIPKPRPQLFPSHHRLLSPSFLQFKGMLLSCWLGTRSRTIITGRGCTVPRAFLARAVRILLLTILSAAPLLSADCIPIQDASHHVGEVECVTGKVLRVKIGIKGVHFIDFCEDEAACPFTVVVFPHDLKDVGDVRRLEGRTIEVNGTVKMYEGRAEIIVNRVSQLRGGAALIPPLPKSYDVEKQGHYSAGHLHPSKKVKKTKAKPSTTATYGNDVEGEQPPE
jgi:hypothetical protein